MFTDMLSWQNHAGFGLRSDSINTTLELVDEGEASPLRNWLR